MIIFKGGSRLHSKLTIWHHSKFFQEVLHSKCIIDRCTCSKIICCTSSKIFLTMCDEHLALFCRSFLCPLTERSRLFMSIQLMFRVLCSEHMGKTNLTILAAVADRPSVWPPQLTASNYILLAVEIKCPFCHEVPQEWRIFQCGHPVCSTCAEVLNSRRRPIDRVCHAQGCKKPIQAVIPFFPGGMV